MKNAPQPVAPTNPITRLSPCWREFATRALSAHILPCWREFATRALSARFLLLFLALWTITVNTHALPRIYGTIIDGADQQPLPSATVTLRRTADSTLVAGAISNADGAFAIDEVPGGDYFLTAGFIGYQSHITAIRLSGDADFHTGPLILQQQSIAVGEALIVAERLRGKSNGQAITWFVNKRMEAASNSGLDLLQHIPGVQVDIMQNLSIQGSSRITVKVNGIVRDVAYLRQLNAGRIERIEMDMTPGAGYDAEAGGVLNIVLKTPETGVGGHVYAEVPLSPNEYYLFPNYSLNAGFGKWQMYTSYDAEISGFDIVERSRHALPGADGGVRFTSRQSVRQDYQSHRFHYGADYTPHPRHQFSFYAYHNPFSNEHNGSVVQESQAAGQAPTQWRGTKTDDDRNSRAFYSLYYKHSFDGGGEWSLDASWYRLKGDHSTRYDYDEPTGVPPVIVAVKPLQQTFSLRTDYQVGLLERWTLKSGISTERKEMEDRLSATFSNTEQVLGAYAQIGGEVAALQVSGGLRAEHWTTRMAGGGDDQAFGLFPHASLQWAVNPRHKLALAYRRSVQRPHIYQLNPYVSTLDNYYTLAGNPALRPVLRSQVQIDHNLTFASNHVGFQLFYAQSKDVISPVTTLSQGLMESQYQNAGDLRQWGFQVTGGLNLFQRLSLSPYFKVFHDQNSGHTLAGGYRVTSQSGWGYDASLSAIVEITKSTVAALVVQHRSAVVTFQNQYYSDALYFVSVDKAIARNWKVGLKSALPLAGSFVYRGHELQTRASSGSSGSSPGHELQTRASSAGTRASSAGTRASSAGTRASSASGPGTHASSAGHSGQGFKSVSSGTIYTSAVPLWLHVRYQFGRGREGRADRVGREERGGKGF